MSRERKLVGDRSRSEDTRYNEQRDREIRAALDMDFDNLMNRIPPHIIPDGMDYALARDSFKEGMHDKNRTANLFRKGWEPVPAERHPELVMNGMFGDYAKQRDGYIYIEGLLLVERPKRYGDIERANMAKKNFLEQSGLPVEEDFARRAIPGRIINSPTTFGHEGPKSFGGF